MTAKTYGRNNTAYVPGNVPEDLIRMVRHISRFWGQGAEGWAPLTAFKALKKVRFESLLSLAKEFPAWYAGHNSSPGQLLLAWVGLGAIAEGTLHWFLSVYAEGYLQDPIFTNTGAMVPPEDVFFAKSITYFNKRIWPDDGTGLFRDKKKQMSDCLHDIRKKRNAIHCGKDEMGTWDEWRNTVEYLLAVICEFEGRIPYPDEGYAYPSDVTEILSFYELGKEVQLQEQPRSQVNLVRN